MISAALGRPESRQLGSQAGCNAKQRPIWMMLSAITPRPTQRCMPLNPRYRQRFNPWRRFSTLMRPSHPVRQRCPARNQRDLCNFLRSLLLVLGLGTATRVTPIP
jgi:hypothetical protein